MNEESIIQTEWTGVRHHPRQPMEKRAAQFSPFAALTGYEEIVAETGRKTDPRKSLTPERAEELDRVFQDMATGLKERQAVRVQGRVFIPDRKKEGGMYRPFGGRVLRIDGDRGRLILETKDDTKAEIPMADISEIEILQGAG